MLPRISFEPFGIAGSIPHPSTICWQPHWGSQPSGPEDHDFRGRTLLLSNGALQLRRGAFLCHSFALLSRLHCYLRCFPPPSRTPFAPMGATLIKWIPMGAPSTPMWINVIPSGASGRGQPFCRSKARTSIPRGRLICVCSSICKPFPWELRYRLLNCERADPSRFSIGRQGDPTWVQVIQKGANGAVENVTGAVENVPSNPTSNFLYIW